MSENRVRARRRMFKTGKIVLSDKAPKVECTVRNLSDTGACLEVSVTFGIPSRFDFICDGVRLPCRVAWIRDKKIGVVFTESSQKRGDLAQRQAAGSLADGTPSFGTVSAVSEG